MTYREALADFTFLRAFRAAGNRPGPRLPRCWIGADLDHLAMMADRSVIDPESVGVTLGDGEPIAYLCDETGLVVAVTDRATRPEYAGWLDWLMGITTVALAGEGGRK